MEQIQEDMILLLFIALQTIVSAAMFVLQCATHANYKRIAIFLLFCVVFVTSRAPMIQPQHKDTCHGAIVLCNTIPSSVREVTHHRSHTTGHRVLTVHPCFYHRVAAASRALGHEINHQSQGHIHRGPTIVARGKRWGRGTHCKPAGGGNEDARGNTVK